MKKQTAVEWLIEQLAKNGVIHSCDINKAKEMERDQIVDAHNNSDPRDSGEQYYNETYGK